MKSVNSFVVRRKVMYLKLVGFVILISLASSCSTKENSLRILVFSKTEDFRHIESIETGITTLKKMGEEHNVLVDTTEDASLFNEQKLKNYNAVIFLNVSGAIFNPEQRIAFQRYIEAGGGFMAIHASTDAERDWPWYNELIGAYFNSHPKVQKGIFQVVDKTHPATDSLPEHFELTDEFYNFQQVNPDIKVLVKIDETSYQGGNMGENHPMVWYHDYDGGRSFYTEMGHTAESYNSPEVKKIIWGGLYYAMGGVDPKPLDYTHVLPEESRFEETVLADNLDEPMQMAFNKEGSIYFVERRGNIRVYDHMIGAVRSIGSIPVDSKYEDGLLGIALDRFNGSNKWIYVFYTPPSGLQFQVSRFTLDPKGMLDNRSEKVLLQIPKQILDGSHTGGALMFDPRGNGDLFITVGDNSSPREWVYAPIDERPGRELWDAQRTSSNTNDLRGKILRIHPEPDGTYSIPEGNLFPKGTARTRPEIYTMGNRQPWRISMDTKTGWLYEGEVGPDSRKDSVGIGPESQDEFNQIRKPGNYGWPYFVGDNKAYWHYDFATKTSGEQYKKERPENTSRLNTGLIQLPPAQPAMIWYPYGTSKEFPLMGTGGRVAVGGPFFRKVDYKHAKKAFPDYYDGKWFITEWLRGWILVVSMDENGNYKSMEPFMPGSKFTALDMNFGPDGSLYVLDYGKGWFTANEDAKLVRIDYNSGNRKPVAHAAVDKKSGAVPLSVKLTSNGSIDYDNDPLSYEWKVVPKSGGETKTFNEPSPSLTFDKTGVYIATLTANDGKGGISGQSIKIQVGNEPPIVQFNITKGNKTFFFPGNSINYKVKVSDKEDSSIHKDKITVAIEYADLEYNPQLGEPDPEKLPKGDNRLDISGGMLLNANDCYSCHAIDKKSVGPTFRQVAERYKNDTSASERLVTKIINGGSGNWGQVVMSAHPDLPQETAKRIVAFIRNFAAASTKSLPLAGSFTTAVPGTKNSSGGEKGQEEMKNDKGVFILQAKYTDGGANGIGPLTSKDVLILRSPNLPINKADKTKGYMNVKLPNTTNELNFLAGDGSYLGFDGLDLTGIRQIVFLVSPLAGGVIEVRLGSATGQVAGQSVPLIADKKNSKLPQRIVVGLNNVQGIHNVYFVAKKQGAKKSDLLFSVQGISVKEDNK